MAVAESGSSLSTGSDASGKSSSSPSSPASTSASASGSAYSGQLSILTPPRAGGTRGKTKNMELEIQLRDTQKEIQPCT